MSRLWTSIYNANTGFVFSNSTCSDWGFICERIAEEFEVDADDLHCVETDDGEFVSCKGEVLAGIHIGPHTIKHGQVYRAHLAQAAE